MLLPIVFITCILVIPLTHCQFVYNYEEPDNDRPNNSEESALYKFNSPSATNEQFQQNRPVMRHSSAENRKTGINRNSERTTTDSSDFQEEPQPVVEAENPRNEPPTQRTRRRKYRRIHKEGNYFEPPQRPMVYSPSVFENIGLGQAPSGVYVPQDSLLNVLKNPNYRREISSQYNPPYSRNYQQQNFQTPVPQERFFIQPPSAQEDRSAGNRMMAIVQPNVQYSSDPSISNEYNTESVAAVPNRQVAQRQRQSTRQEPTVDIDALRTHRDVMPVGPLIPQVTATTQARSVSQSRRRQILPIQNYQSSIATPKVYSPSIFQNIGLGEAPTGVHIPQDSLLNVLRSSGSRAEATPRQVMRNSQPTPESVDHGEAEEVYYQPPISVQSDYTPRDSRRRTRQRSRVVTVSGQNTERGANHQSDIEEQAAPAPSHQPRRQRGQADNSIRNRKPETRVSERRQTTRTETKHPQESSTGRQQQNFKPAKLAIAALPEDTDEDGIPGEAGTNYPTLHVIPRTTFSCSQQQYNGYYADLETSCQVVHLCQAGGVKSSFLCPNGTIFSQEKFSCQWWYKVNCEDSPNFYAINDSLYKTPERKKSGKQ